jgi:DNA processing protein
MEDELQHRLAVTLIPGIGDVLAKNLISYCGGAADVFKAKMKELIRVPGIDQTRAEAILHFDGWKEVEREISFIEKNGITSTFYLDRHYPSRLKGITDAPLFLFSKGNVNWNETRMVAMVGTRHATDYGKQITETLIDGLRPFGATIVSGLAYGIDIAAHRAALKNQMPTLAVLAHGLNRLYPGSHRSVATHLLENGGLVTEFKCIDDFEPQNFPKRNRIVAGMCDCVIVVESAPNGGALITAEIANNYNRDVFCVPGKAGEKYSAGCNYFIRLNKATLVENAEHVAYAMNWINEKTLQPRQKEIFIELSTDEKKITEALSGSDPMHVDALSEKTVLFGSGLAAALLNLEFNGVVKALPGKMYRLA